MCNLYQGRKTMQIIININSSHDHGKGRSKVGIQRKHEPGKINTTVLCDHLSRLACPLRLVSPSVRITVHSTSTFLVSHTSATKGENSQCQLLKESGNGAYQCFSKFVANYTNSLKFQSRLEHKYLETELMTNFWKSS